MYKGKWALERNPYGHRKNVRTTHRDPGQDWTWSLEQWGGNSTHWIIVLFLHAYSLNMQQRAWKLQRKGDEVFGHWLETWDAAPVEISGGESSDRARRILALGAGRLFQNLGAGFSSNVLTAVQCSHVCGWQQTFHRSKTKARAKEFTQRRAWLIAIYTGCSDLPSFSLTLRAWLCFR